MTTAERFLELQEHEESEAIGVWNVNDSCIVFILNGSFIAMNSPFLDNIFLTFLDINK